jgi:alkylation response protein AidB-like acyl-CoA dehydrogenase
LVYLGHGSHALGIARAAIDDVIAQKTATADARGTLREQTRLQAQIAEARALIESGRRFLYGAAEDLWLTVLTGDNGTPEQHAQVRLAISHAAKSAVQAVDLLYAAAGTAAVFEESPLDRRFRDIHTAAAHVMVGPTTFEAAGRVALGLGAGMPFFS